MLSRPVRTFHALNERSPEGRVPVDVQRVASFHTQQETTRATAASDEVTLNCPGSILNAFKDLLRGSALLGAPLRNPYPCDPKNAWVHIPHDAEALTARHLQILARNERLNVTGVMDTTLYPPSFTPDQIARLRCLVKATMGSGLVHPTCYDGYPGHRATRDQLPGAKAIVIDQSGLQWQGDHRNTGGMFFYPDEPNHARLPATYAAWQRDMYRAMYGLERPTVEAVQQSIRIQWRDVPGRLDLNALKSAFAVDFYQALDAAVYQGNLSLDDGEVINFKFLKSGMGFFASGLLTENRASLFDNPTLDEQVELELARLSGIEQALQTIQRLPETERQAALGLVRRIELPFSAVPADSRKNTALARIETLVEQLGLTWGGTPLEDALTPRVGFVNALTNAGDPHAMIGNEGAYQSVDAAIATNTPDIDRLNAMYNHFIQPRVSLDPHALFQIPAPVPALKPAIFTGRAEFNVQLELITNKAQQLREEGHTTAADAANGLYTSIAENARKFFASEISEYKFKTLCAEAISEARPALDALGWKEILGNLALAILGLGLVYVAACLINKAVTGHFLFFRTDAAKKVDALEVKILDVALTAPAA